MASDLPPLLPPDDPIVSPDDDLATLRAQTLVDDDEIAVGPPPPPPIGRSWHFDWTLPGFPLQDSQIDGLAHAPSDTYDVITLEQWIEKTIRTARGAHPIYPSDYGMENPFEFYGRTLFAADYVALEGRVREALTFHPRIADIANFVASQDPNDDVLLVNFDYVLDDGTVANVSNLRLVP